MTIEEMSKWLYEFIDENEVHPSENQILEILEKEADGIMLTDEEKDAVNMIIGIFQYMKDGELFERFSYEVKKALLSAKEKCALNYNAQRSV